MDDKLIQEEIVFNLASDINLAALELHELTKVIRDLDAELVKNETEENRLFMHETIERYKKVVNKTRILCEAYFAEERKLEDHPSDFTFRRLYKKLKEAL